jgi:4a-hydroxytetrahydrobiopterin dehydratase
MWVMDVASRRFGSGFGVDQGTGNTVVGHPGRDIVLNEPSVMVVGAEVQTPLERAIVAPGDRTRRTILLGFHEDPHGQTVDQVAAAGVHRTVAFQHLERLAALGYLATDRRRGVPGKPAKVYRLVGGPIEVSRPARLYRHLAGLRPRWGGRAAPDARPAGRWDWTSGARWGGPPRGSWRRWPAGGHGGRHALEPGTRTLVALNCLFQEACQHSPQVVCCVHAGMLEGVLAAAGQGHRSCRWGRDPTEAARSPWRVMGRLHEVSDATRLSAEEIAERLANLAGWQVRDGKLVRDYQFGDYMRGIDFVNRVAGVAEAEGHHPDLFVTWGRVTVQLTSHSAGGLTATDFRLASLIDGVFTGGN